MGQRQRPRPKRLASKLRRIRAQLGLTQEQMAEALKHIESSPQPGHISEFESGRREPSLLFLLAVSRMAGVPMEDLVDDEIDLPDKLSPGTLPKRITPKSSSRPTRARKR
jgi:transcriptional regulator with XRE-family HTH domain